MNTAVIERPEETTSRAPAPVVALKRRTIDTVLIGFGVVAAVVFAVAGGAAHLGPQLLQRLRRRRAVLAEHHLPSAEALTEEGRTDLRQVRRPKLDTGDEAEGYASFINGHLQGVADGATYADLGAPESAAKADVKAAVDAGAAAGQRSTSCRPRPTASPASATPSSRARPCGACSSRPTPGPPSA